MLKDDLQEEFENLLREKEESDGEDMNLDFKDDMVIEAYRNGIRIK